MKISNFRDMTAVGTNPIDWKYFATVDVETGPWWRRRKAARSVSRTYANYWFFVDSGESCPGFVVEQLERGYVARQEMEKARA